MKNRLPIFVPRDAVEITPTPRKLVRSTQSISKQIFEMDRVVFVNQSVDLTKQRIQLLIDLVVKHGGQGYDNIEEIQMLRMKQETTMDPINIIIISPSENLQLLQQLDKMGIGYEEAIQLILKPDWISQSISHQTRLRPHMYRVYRTENTNDQAFEDDTQEQIHPSIAFTVSEMDAKDKRYWKNLNKKLMRVWKERIDYMFDERLQNFHDDDDDDIDGEICDMSIIKKEEYIQPLGGGTVPTFQGDEECFITEVKQVPQDAVAVLEDLPKIESNKSFKKPLRKRQNLIVMSARDKKWEKFLTTQSTVIVNNDEQNISQNLNQHILEPLERLYKIYCNDRDKGRIIAYTKAVSFIKALKFKITNISQVDNMPTIGQKIRQKIVEILQTGRLSKADKLDALESNQVQNVFSQVWGIGASKAATLYLKGLKTLEDLQKNEHLLTKNQRIGLKYINELKIRIPRQEAEEIVAKIRGVIMQVGGPHYIAEACGSYRRGKSDCGDIDVLITRTDNKNTSGFLKAVVDELCKDLITDSLVDPKVSATGTESYMGIGQLRPDLPHRRIDLKLYPASQFGFAVLYFTGSDNFNRAMRLFASKIGYQLSDHGLYAIEKNHKKKIVSAKGASVCCEREEDVFKFLKIKYVPPQNRSS